MRLRSYQENGISDIRALFVQGRQKVCYAAPTGSGKTILFFISLTGSLKKTSASPSSFIVKSWSTKSARRSKPKVLLTV